MAKLFLSCIALSLVGVLIGCSRGPSRVEPPRIDAESAAAQAISLYDNNQNGSLNTTELAACPGMLAQISAYDTDANGEITAAEISNRLASLFKAKVGLTALMCEIRVNGKPLSNAEVVFDPEPYLGDDMKQAVGTTDFSGSAEMGISDEDMPRDLKGVKAIQYGTFKVRVTHPSVTIPAKYNSNTTLGYETISGSPFAKFALKIP
jgi:hypothetical protein